MCQVVFLACGQTVCNLQANGIYFKLGKAAVTKLEYTFKTETMFKADTKEELAKIESMEVPVMEQAIKAYHQEGNLRPAGSVEVQEGNLRPAGSVEVQITAESEFRERERLYSIARHNEAAALRHARDKARAEGRTEGKEEGRAEGRAEGVEKVAQKMKEMGFTKEQIQTATGLSLE